MPLQLSSSVSILNEVLHTFLVSSDGELAINRILERVGRHFGVSRVYIFENASHELTFSNTYEWCDAGVKSEKNVLQRIPLSILEGYYHVFDKNNILSVPDIATLPEYLNEYLKPQGIQALLQVALVVNGERIGMVGFDECRAPRQWTEDEVSTLSILAQILNVFILNHRSDQRSRLNKGLALNIIDNLESLVYVIDVETHNLLYVNDKLKETVPEAELGTPCYKALMPGRDSPCEFCPVSTYKRHPEITRTVFDLHNEMFDIWGTVHSSIFEWFDGRKVCFVSVNDISDRRRHEIKLEHLAYTDELTGLPNNRRFQRDGPVYLASAEHRGMDMGIIILKLESLHRINSTRGYEQGDEILKTFANAVNRILPSESLFARIRGNDFAILYPYEKRQGKAAIEDLMRKVCRTAGKIRLPSSIHGWLGVGSGISLYPEDGESFDLLLRKAGLALTTSDASSPTPYVFYDAVVTAEQLAQDRLSQELALSLHNGELELYYQPKIDVKTSHVCGTEALMRWHHPEHGLLPGGAFIQLAEERGLISDIDEWVINEACRHIKLLRDTGCHPVPTAINLSPDKFYQDDILTKLTSALKRYDVPPELLEVELTERIALENLDKAISIMQQIRALGIKISIDDFGTGYSSLNYLRILPIDAVKLDRSFLSNIEHDMAARRIVGFVVLLAGQLNATVIMEGVETEEQYQFAKEISCDVVQGYYTGRPAPLSELASRLADENRPVDTRKPPHAINALIKPGLKRRLPSILAVCAAFLAGMLVYAASGAPCGRNGPLSPEHVQSSLLIAGIAVTGLAGISIFLAWKYVSLFKRSLKSADQLDRLCRGVLRGVPNKDFHLNLPDPFTGIGDAVTATAQKLYARNVELDERETTLERDNARLKEEHGKYRTIAEAVSDVLWELDLSSSVMHLADNFMEFSGYAKQDFKYPEEVMLYIHPEDREAVFSHIQSLMASEPSNRGVEFRVRISNGAHVWLRSGGSLICDAQGNPLRVVGAFSNISVYKQQELALIARSQRDPLTGLLNRNEGETRVIRKLATPHGTLLLLIVGISNFRTLNTQAGMEGGDALLRAVAKRLSGVTEENDVLFRYAGNEFGLLKALSPDTSPETFALELLQRINEPYTYQNTTFSLQCALAVLVVDGGESWDGSLLLRRAYETLGKAQHSGGCSIRHISTEELFE